MSALVVSDFLDKIDRIVAERTISDHPMVHDIASGAATRESIANFAKHFYWIAPEPSPRPEAIIYGMAPPDPDIEEHLLADVIVEEGMGAVSGTSKHLTIYYDWCSELGVSKADLEATDPIPECKAFVHWRFIDAYRGDWLSAIAGFSFIEGASSHRNDIFVDAFAEHYGFEKGSKGLLFWELHASEVEEGHGDIGRVIVERYANDELSQARVMAAVSTSIDMQRLAFDGMYRAFFLQDPAYARWRN